MRLAKYFHVVIEEQSFEDLKSHRIFRVTEYFSCVTVGGLESEIVKIES